MLYYGTNKTDNTPIMYDRTDITSKPQHRAIFGTVGSGRHVLMKSEIIQILKETHDTVYVLDVAGDFISMAEQLGGTVISVTASGIGAVNPVVIPDTNRLVVLDVSQLANAIAKKRYRREAVYMCLAAMWEKVEAASKAAEAKRFWVYLDEADKTILPAPNDEIFYMMIIKSRTHNCNITYSGHYISEFGDTEYGRYILENTSVVTLLNQTMRDGLFLHKQLQVYQNDYFQWLNNQPCGNGLFCVNGNNIPFKYDTNAYLDDKSGIK